MWWLPLLLNTFRRNAMTSSKLLTAIRKRHHLLDALPDTILIPSLGAKHPEQIAKPLTEASLDDVAFALRGLDAEFSAMSERLYALKRLYQLARDAGALGADRAIQVVANAKGER